MSIRALFSHGRQRDFDDEVDTLDSETEELMQPDEFGDSFVSDRSDTSIEYFNPDDLSYDEPDDDFDEDSEEYESRADIRANHKLNTVIAVLAIIIIAVFTIVILAYNNYQKNYCHFSVDTDLFYFRLNPDCLNIESELNNYQLNASGTITVYPGEELDKEKSFIEIRFLSPLNISKHSLLSSVLKDYQLIDETDGYVVGEYDDGTTVTKAKVIQRQSMAILIYFQYVEDNLLVPVNNTQVSIEDVMQQVFESIDFSDNIEAGLQEYNNEQVSIRSIYDSLTKEYKMTYKDGSEIYYDSANLLIFRINDSENIEFYDYETKEFSEQIPTTKINLVDYFKVEDQEIYYGKNP